MEGEVLIISRARGDGVDQRGEFSHALVVDLLRVVGRLVVIVMGSSEQVQYRQIFVVERSLVRRPYTRRIFFDVQTVNRRVEDLVPFRGRSRS